MLMETIGLIFGLIFILFLPGFIIAETFISKSEKIERILVSFGVSVFVQVMIAFSLGFNASVAEFTGGISRLNVFFVNSLVCLVFGIVLAFKKIHIQK